MGIYTSVLTKSDDVAGTKLGDSLEVFQEKVNGIGSATEELKTCFGKVLSRANELEEYLSSLPVIPGDDRSDGQQNGEECKKRSLASLKKFRAALFEHETDTRKTVQDLLNFAKQQLESICHTTTGCGSFINIDFPKYTDKGMDTYRHEDNNSPAKGDIDTNSMKPINVEDILALFYTEENLLKERNEIQKERFQERQRHDAEMELLVENLNKLQNELKHELQKERSKVKMLEKNKEENLKKDLTTQYFVKDNANNDWSEIIQENEEKTGYHQMDLKDKMLRSKPRGMEQDLPSEQIVTFSEILTKEQENMKTYHTSISDQLSQLQTLVNDNKNKQWSKLIQEKEEEIKNIRKDFFDTLEHYKDEITNLKQELQSERFEAGKLDRLQDENDILKNDKIILSDQLQRLKNELTDQSSLHEDERKKWWNSIKDKEDKIEQYRKELNDANKEYANEIANDIRSIKENVDLINKKSTDLKQKESEISSTKERLKSKKGILLKEISDLKTALNKVNGEKEYIMQQHEKINETNTNKMQNMEEKNRVLQREIAQFRKTKREMQDQLELQKQETSGLKMENNEQNKKCEQLTHDIQQLKEENKKLDKKNKDIEKEKSNVETNLTSESQKSVNALKECQALQQLLEERETSKRLMTIEFEKLQKAANQFSRNCEEKEEEIQNQQKVFNDKIEEYRSKNINLEKELQFERSKVRILDKLQEENDTLKSDKTRLSGQLQQLQHKLTERSSIHEEDRKKWWNSIKEKEEKIEQYRKDLKEANKDFANEIANSIRSIKENMDVIYKQNADLNNKEAEITEIKRKFKSKREILLKEISDLNTAVDRVNVDKEYIMKQHEEIKVAYTNKMQKFEKKVRDLELEIVQLNESKQEMQNKIELQKQTANDLKIANDKQNEKCVHLTHDFQELKEKNEKLDKKNKEIEKEKSIVEMKLTSESRKSDHAVEECQALKKLLDEQGATLCLKTNELEKLQRVEEELSKKCKDKEKEMQTLKLHYDETCKEKELLVERLKKDNEQLNLRLNMENKKYESLRKTVSTLEQDFQKKNEENAQVVQDYENKLKNLGTIIEQHKADLKQCNLTNGVLVSEKIKLSQDLDQCKTTLKTSEIANNKANQGIKQLREKIEETETLKENAIKELKSQKHETGSLTEKLQHQRNICKKQSDELEDAKTQLRNLTREINELQKLNSSKNDKIAEVERKADEANMENKKLSVKYESLFNAHEKVNGELTRLKAIQTLKIQMYSNNRRDMINGVEAELMAKLRSSLENDKLKLKFSHCAKKTEIEPNIPTLLLCITATRLGTDVSNAIQDLTLTHSMALVIFHHKDTHALPSQASDRVLSGSELSGIGGIFDFAFLAATGMHNNCKLNNNNFVSLVHFITKKNCEEMSTEHL